MANDWKKYHADKKSGGLGSLSRNADNSKDKTSITKEFRSQEDWEAYLVFEREVMIKVLGIDPDDEDPVIQAELNDPHSLFNVLLREDWDELNTNSARRTGKSHKIMVRMILRWLFLPWYNAVMVRKYNRQVAKMLADPAKGLLQEMLLTGVIPEEVYKAIEMTNEQLTFRGRKLIFASSQNPHNTFNLKAGSTDALYNRKFRMIDVEGKKKQEKEWLEEEAPVHSQFCEFFIDEIVEAEDNMEVTYEQQDRAHKRMTESLNRGLIAPYGKSWRQLTASNPWDDSHPIYLEIEDRIPVGREYQTAEKDNLAKANINELIGEEGSGKISKTTTLERVNNKNELIETTIVDWRGSYKNIPDSRFNISVQNEYADYMERDIETWMVVFGGIHGTMSGTKHTYRKHMVSTKRAGIWMGWEKIKPMMSNVYFGMDRGKRDLTALTLAGFGTRDLINQAPITDDREIKKMMKNQFFDYDIDHKTWDKYQWAMRDNIQDIVNTIEAWFLKYDLYEYLNFHQGSKIPVQIDPTASDFIKMMQEELEQRELRHYVEIKAAKLDKKNKDQIANRVDSDRDLFARVQHFMNPEGEETMDLFMAYNNCMDREDEYARDERPGRNNYILDRINSREMCRPTYKDIFPLIHWD